MSILLIIVRNQQKDSYITVLHHLLRWRCFGQTPVKQGIVVKAALWVEDMKAFGNTYSNLVPCQ